MSYLDYLFIHDVAAKVGNPGLIGAVAAGLATFALISGVAQLKRTSLPKSFPGDAEALQPKYFLAFKQLENEHSASGGSAEGARTNAAEQLALSAYSQYSKSEELKAKGTLKR